jgi:protein-histidine pros-kinase
MKWPIAVKLNLVLLPLFALALLGSGVIVQRVMADSARQETLRTARLIMSAALATRTYTVDQVQPLLAAKYDFLVQTVSAYAASETHRLIQRQFPDYGYREAALNPTNKRDQADAWETEVIRKLALDPNLTEYSGVLDTLSGQSVFVAHPIRITNGACLTCHSRPENAPQTMIDTYGRDGGFGWKLNEVVGAQVVTVPTVVPSERAATAFRQTMLAIGGVFVVLLIALNILVHLLVTRRVREMSRFAELVSTGKPGAGEFDASGSDEISALARSFMRMRTSLASAMKMLEP